MVILKLLFSLFGYYVLILYTCIVGILSKLGTVHRNADTYIMSLRSFSLKKTKWQHNDILKYKENTNRSKTNRFSENLRKTITVEACL